MLCFLKLHNTTSQKSDLVQVESICRIAKEGKSSRIYWQNNSTLYDIDFGVLCDMLTKINCGIMTEQMLNDNFNDHWVPFADPT